MAPGPGYYDPKLSKPRKAITGAGTMTSKVITTACIITFIVFLEKTKRFPAPNFITPGPGTYSVTQPVVNPVVTLQPPMNVEVNI